MPPRSAPIGGLDVDRPGTGAILHCTMPTIDAARDYFGTPYGYDLRIIWL